MGQQQLLLLVLGIVIVGLAVVVGIQAFGENQKKANADAMVNDAIRIASDAQAWTLKPTAFGGGNGSATTVTLDKLGYQTTSSTYNNLNGAFTLTVSGTGTSQAIAILGSNTGRGNFVRADIFGTGPNCIVTQVANAAIGTAGTDPGCDFS